MTLDDILNSTRQESAKRQREFPLAEVRRKVEKMGPTRGFARTLRQRRFSVIAEIKRRSPSMDSINETAIRDAHEIYHKHPVVSAISVLTQNAQFGGTTDDLKRVWKLMRVRPKPLLRKDFIFSEYEVYFSRWIGADAILLMANVVTDRSEFKRLHDLGVSIGLDVLCEVHDETEIGIIPDTARICGINSRRFKGVNQHKPIGLKVREFLGVSAPNRDTQTDLSVFKLFSQLPPHCLKVAESGVSSDNIGSVLAQQPFNAALIGTSLLKAGRDHMWAHLDNIQAQAEKALETQTTAPAGEIAYAR